MFDWGERSDATSLLGNRRGMVAHALELVGNMIEGEKVAKVAGDRSLHGDRLGNKLRCAALKLVDCAVRFDDSLGGGSIA